MKIFFLIVASVSVLSHTVWGQEQCNTPSRTVYCEFPGYETTYRQLGVQPGFTTNLLAYTYSGSEYFTGLTGLQCGRGPSKLTMVLYGDQASEFYDQLKLPEHESGPPAFEQYKVLYSDSSTEGQHKDFELACQRYTDSIFQKKLTTCYLQAVNVPRVFPCVGQSKVLKFEGRTHGGLVGELLRQALGKSHFEFNFSNGKHVINCDDEVSHGCQLTVLLQGQ